MLSLVLFCVFELGNPLQALAEELENIEDIAAYADANTFSAGTFLEYSPLVGKKESNSEENRRVFRRGDGALEAMTYAQPVCYWDEGQWKLIDNTLVPVTLSDGTEVYQNKSSDMTVSFGQRFNSDKLVTIEQGEHTLSWRFVGNISAELEPVQMPSAEVIETPAPAEPESVEIEETPDSIEPATADIEDAPVSAEPEAGDFEDTAQQPEATEETENNGEGNAQTVEECDTLTITAVNGQVHNGESRTVSSEEEADDLLRFPPELVSEMEYTDATTGLNVRYVLNGKTLYEYITLEEAPQSAVAYFMELQVDGLTPVLQDGMLYFADGQGKSVFQMGQPVMVDATGAQSLEIETQLSTYNEETGTYLFTLIPDQD